MWSVYSPCRSSYTLDLEALQDVVPALLRNLVIDRGDQALIDVVNNDQVNVIAPLPAPATEPADPLRRRKPMAHWNGTILYMPIRVIMIHSCIIL